jgi:hypothetical protein
MEKARKRLNSYAATRTIGMGGAYIKYPNIYLANTELWSADGIKFVQINSWLGVQNVHQSFNHFI